MQIQFENAAELFSAITRNPICVKQLNIFQKTHLIRLIIGCNVKNAREAIDAMNASKIKNGSISFNENDLKKKVV